MKINSLSILLYWVPALLAALAPIAHADTCNASTRPRSTPTERFTLNDNGSVIDKKTGLTWMRCALGQTWGAGTCTGTATVFTWQDTDWAKDIVNLDGYAGHTDWRIPLVPELASIVELGCLDHRINPTVFPQTPTGVFWTSSEKPKAEDYAYTLDFGAGGATAKLKTTPGTLRLVRGRPWTSTPK